MTEKKLLTSECSKCGAPLIRRERVLFCEYCKTSYELPYEYYGIQRGNDQNEIYHRDSKKPGAENRQPAINSSQSQPRSGKKTVGIILLGLVGVCILFGSFLITTKSKGKTSSENPIQQIEKQMFSMNSSAMPDEYPADFVHNQQLSIGVMLDYISQSYFSISIYAKNKLDRTIQANLKTDQMVISSLNIEDSLGNQYSCEIENEFTGSIDKMNPGDFASISDLFCKPGLIPPDVKYINLKVSFTNWGNYDFQIPLDLNFQEVRIKYYLKRYDDSFDVTSTFFATIPQYIVVNYDDISVIDDKGNYYPIEYCDIHGTIGRDSEKYRSFIALAERYDPGSSFYCHFNSPVPYEVNAITFVMNVRGNTVTQTITTDTVQ